MTDHKRLTAEELAEIRKRAEKATEGNPLRDSGALAKMYDSIDDVLKLLAEIERLKAENERLIQEKRQRVAILREWSGDYR